MRIEARNTAREEYCAEYYLNRNAKQWNIEVILYRNGAVLNQSRVMLPQLNFWQCHALLKILCRNCVLPKTLEEVIRELLEDASPKVFYLSRNASLPNFMKQLHL